jgi:hypothetical protein
MRCGIAFAVLPGGAAEFDTQRGTCEFFNSLLNSEAIPLSQ